MSYETYAEIRLDNIAHNIRELRKLMGGSEILAVLKADAYGHKASEIFKLLLDKDISRFAVANIFEAMELRKINSGADILIFGYIDPDNMKTVVENNITLTIFSPDYWHVLRQRLDAKKVKAHIKLNTGFNRLGFDYSVSALDTIEEICHHELVDAEGIYTHLALNSEEADKAQFDSFNRFVREIEERSISFKYKHIADSIAAVNYDWARLGMVRLGAVIYGLRADGYEGYDRLELKPSMKLWSTVSQVRMVRKGESVSYGDFTAENDMKVATLAFGFSDGYPRCLSNKGFVMINGKKCGIIGLICMDQCMADVTDVDVKISDKVLVYDIDHNSPVSVAKLAALAGTNKNELVSALARRVPRVYINGFETYSEYI